MGPILAILGVCTFIGWVIGSVKGQGAAGLILGLLLGPLGILAALIIKPAVAVQARRDVALEAERDRLRNQAE
jgi:F0F1-type ATP synthase assembly protein I